MPHSRVVPDEPTAPETPPRPVTQGGGLAVAIGAMNIATYAFTIIAARTLGPQQYGAFAAVMNLLTVVAVAQLALQAVAARRISAAPGDVAVVEDEIRTLTWRVALALGLLLLVAAPLVDVVLRLDSLPTAILVALTAVPLTLTGGLAGTLQGERRWRPLAALYLALGVPRLLIGTAMLLWQPSETSAIAGVFLASLAPVAVGVWALRHRPHVPHGPSDADHGPRALLREAFRNSHALLGFFAVSNVDIIVARNVLDGHDAGLYAGALILTKAMLFLPQFVVIIAFPDLATAESRRRALRVSLALVLGAGTVGVLASWLLSGVALVFVGGSEYAEIQDRLWLFAVLGTVLSTIQLLVYALMARQSSHGGGRASRAVHLLWVALLAIIVAGQLVDSLTSLVVTVLVIDLVLLAALLVPTAMHDARRDAEVPATPGG